MAAIKALLNPIKAEGDSSDEDLRRRPYSTGPSQPCYSRGASPTGSPHKKVKVCKDAPIFTRGPTRGELRYLPYECDDVELKKVHQQFGMFPMEGLADFPRHIPYNSEKKLYLDKTGRDFFEVFQYSFKVPDSDTTWTLLWDYNIGLVRTTPLFKCCGYGKKTTPAKMLNKNVGLRDICHSITGGALVAQGYWIPYEAAKAIAATFCYNIRHVLTPVFGIDFIDLCVPPESGKFGTMLIDAEITQVCARKAAEYRKMELENPTARPTSATSSPRTPRTTKFPRALKHARIKEVSDTASSSGYSTATSDDDDNYTLSPHAPSFRNVWTAVNVPRSVPPPDDEMVSPKSVYPHLKPKPRGYVQPTPMSSPASSTGSARRAFDRMEIDQVYDGDKSDAGSVRYTAGSEEPEEFGDEDAARALMALSSTAQAKSQVVLPMAKRRRSASF